MGLNLILQRYICFHPFDLKGKKKRHYLKFEFNDFRGNFAPSKGMEIFRAGEKKSSEPWQVIEEGQTLAGVTLAEHSL